MVTKALTLLLEKSNSTDFQGYRKMPLEGKQFYMAPSSTQELVHNVTKNLRLTLLNKLKKIPTDHHVKLTNKSM